MPRANVTCLRICGRLIIVHCFACNRSPMAIGRHEIGSLAEAALVIAVIALAIRNRTLKKEKDSCSSNCVRCEIGNRKQTESQLLLKYGKRLLG